jgi:hypothetical protein
MINGVKTVLRKVSTTILSVLLSLVIVALTFVGGTFIANSQNLDYLPQSQRDSILISTAKEAVLRYGPGYYREYKEPVIKWGHTPPKGTLNPTGKNAGRKMYNVFFLYDTTMELLETPFAAKVNIWADNGNLNGIAFGNGVWLIVELEPDLEKRKMIPQIQYEQRSGVRVIIYENDEKEPKNISIEELKRRGYEEVSERQWMKTRKDVPPNIDILKREGYEEINGQWVKTKKKVPAQIK